MSSDDYRGDEELLAVMNIGASFRSKDWVDVCIGILLWEILLMAFIVTIPFTIVGRLRDAARPSWLKFRYLLAEKIRPDGFVHAPTMGQSDLIREFVEYEISVAKGREKPHDRIKLISRIGNMEKELTDYRALAADVKKQWMEQQKHPRRREAIQATLAKRRATDNRQ